MAKSAPPEAKKMIGGGLQVSASGEQRRGGKKHVREIRTKRAKGGGHVLTHEFESGPDMGYHPGEDHVFGKDEGEKHMKHYMRHAGITGVKVSSAADDGTPSDVSLEEGAKNKDQPAKRKGAKARAEAKGGDTEESEEIA